ncbi:MAG: VanZ family protein [Acidobacteriota bacterium]
MNKTRKILAWLWVSLCILAIFLVVPLARVIQKFVSSHWGRSLFGYVVLAATTLAFCGLLYVLVFRLKIRTPSNYFWLTGVACLYVYFTLQLWRAPEEAVHFLEYGLLGYFLFRALSLSIRDKSIYPTAFLIGAMVGIFDEILQWVMPNRYWDFRDAGLNAIAAGLFQVAVWKGIKPRAISDKIGPLAVRRVSLLLAVNIVLLGLCASNTPQRVASYTGRLRFLSFLLKEEPMYEFTRKIKVPEIGTFFSRLTAEELEQEDSRNSDHWAAMLRDWKNRDYGQFLREFHPLLHPFLYEMRVHIFRRDRRLEEAAKANGKKKRADALFIAAKENLILEKYFGRTLEKSSYSWGAEQKEGAQSAVDFRRPYRSPVSAGRFQVKEKSLWLGIFIFILALAGSNLAYARTKESK